MWAGPETTALPPSLVRVHSCLETISRGPAGSCEGSLRQILPFVDPLLTVFILFPEDSFYFGQFSSRVGCGLLSLRFEFFGGAGRMIV